MVTDTIAKSKVVLVDLKDVLPNPYQPESRLHGDPATTEKFGLSIMEHGLLLTPVARQVTGHYEMADGWQRLLGFKWLVEKAHMAYEKIPLQVRELTDEQMADMVMEANTIRKDLTDIELAWLYKKYMDEFGLTQADLAKKHSCTQGEISNTIRLLELPEDIKAKIISQEMTATHGRQLLRLNEHPELQKEMVKELEKRPKSVNELSNDIATKIFLKSKSLTGGYLEFDPEKECVGCKNRQKLGHPYSKDKSEWRCTDPECWDKKDNAGEKAKVVEAVEKTNKISKETGLKVMDSSKLHGHYSAFIRWDGKPYFPESEECSTCKKKAVVNVGYMGEKPEICCLNLECFNKKKSAYERVFSAEKQRVAQDENGDFKTVLQDLEKLAHVMDNKVPLYLIVKSMIEYMYHEPTKNLYRVITVPLVGTSKKLDSSALLELIKTYDYNSLLQLAVAITYIEEKYYRTGQDKCTGMLTALKEALPAHTMTPEMEKAIGPLEEPVRTEEPATLKTYRIQNKKTKKYTGIDLKALSAQEACEMTGWPLEDCYVRVKTAKGGWANA